jgi:dynein heavy chain
MTLLCLRYVHHPSFTPAAVEQVSKACCSLCMWVLAVNEYAKARANVKEKGRRLAAVQRKVDEEAMRLQERRSALQAEESEMGRLKRRYVEVGQSPKFVK